MAVVHLAHFPGTIEDSMESLCGTTGMCSSNPKAVDCTACRIIIDWALERGLFVRVPGPIEFWVVNGEPPRGLIKDERDGYEFWFSNQHPVRIPHRQTVHSEPHDIWVTGRGCIRTPERTYEHVEYRLVYATEIPRPFIGRSLLSSVLGGELFDATGDVR
jgi:hypothetical protein